MTILRSVLFASVVLGLIVGVDNAAARPAYFDNFKNLYGVGPGDNLEACGTCHIKWTGTGARNLYGTAIEQQLYVGKTILQSLMDVEPDDSDGDGFSNIDEIATYMTLPGYNCANFQDANGAPTDVHTYIEPLVASCLDPHDIRVDATSYNFLGEVGSTVSISLEVFNNGTDFDVVVSALHFDGASNAAFSVTGVPPVPFNIAVGASIVVQVEFSPVTPVVASGTLRIESDDPDEPLITIDANGLGFVKVIASPEARATCFATVDRALRKYGKLHLKEWTRCYSDEVLGKACDTGSRDLRLGKAEAKLRAVVGGPKDKACSSEGLTTGLLDVSGACDGGCSDIQINGFASYVDCLVCRQDEEMGTLLTASMGTAPPDLPPNTVTDAVAASCQRRLIKATAKAVDKIAKELAPCELGNIIAASPADCAADAAPALTKIRDKTDGAIYKCDSTAEMAGCLFEMSPNPACLSAQAQGSAAALIDTMLGTAE